MPRQRLSRIRPVLAGAAAAALAAGVASSIMLGSGTANAGTLTGTLYRSPNSAVVNWVNSNPNDHRTAAIRDKIAYQPTAVWFTQFNVSGIEAQAAAYINAANSAGQIPQMVLYNIPRRDCGQYSAGGAPNVGAYQEWIDNLVRGLGNRPVVILLETDSLALVTCLSSTELTDRYNALATATRKIKAANPNARVYLDGGHSAWNSAAEQAGRLDAAGVRSGDGFFTNVANFRTTSNEIEYGRQILSALNASNLHQIIDTSRNGAGPKGSEWCDPTGRRVGQAPTTNTGEETVDAYIWVKPPGEADGCAATPGTFLPDYAYEMAGGANYTPNPVTTAPATTPPATTPPATTPPATTPPFTSPPASPTGTPSMTMPPLTTRPPSSSVPPNTPETNPTPARSCSVRYRVDSQWDTGFIGNVTITNTGAATMSRWTLTFTFPGNQQVVNLWNGTYGQSGPNVAVLNAVHNAVIPPGGSQTIGFQGTYSGTNAVPRLFGIDSTACATG